MEQLLLVSLTHYLLLAMAAWEPHANHAAVESFDVTEERYEEFASDIAQVMLDPETTPIVFVKGDDPSNRAETALLIVSIAVDESHYKNSTMSCEDAGDGGTAWGPFQTTIQKKITCSDFPGATRVALGMVQESFHVCSALPLESRLAEYTDGFRWNSERAERRSQKKMGRAIRFWIAHPFQVPAE